MCAFILRVIIEVFEYVCVLFNCVKYSANIFGLALGYTFVWARIGTQIYCILFNTKLKFLRLDINNHVQQHLKFKWKLSRNFESMLKP